MVPSHNVEATIINNKHIHVYTCTCSIATNRLHLDVCMTCSSYIQVPNSKTTYSAHQWHMPSTSWHGEPFISRNTSTILHVYMYCTTIHSLSQLLCTYTHIYCTCKHTCTFICTTCLRTYIRLHLHVHIYT